jgi:hypothetical protein
MHLINEVIHKPYFIALTSRVRRHSCSDHSLDEWSFWEMVLIVFCYDLMHTPRFQTRRSPYVTWRVNKTPFYFCLAVGLFSSRFLHETETEFWIMEILLNSPRCLLCLWNCDVNKKKTVPMRWMVGIKHFSRFILENLWGIVYKYCWNMIFEFHDIARRISLLIDRKLTFPRDRTYYSCFVKREET